MGRVNKFTSIILLVFNFMNVCVADEQKIPIRFERKEKELSNVYVQRLYNGQKDDASDEDFEYICNTAKKIAKFLSTLNKIEVSDYSQLIGNYKLINSDNKYIIDSNNFFLNNYVSIISIDTRVLCFQSQSSTTEIYQDVNRSLFFRSRWIEVIRQLKFIDDKMYIYILDGDYWVLDPIHEGGKYFFKKVDDNEEGKVIDITEFIK